MIEEQWSEAYSVSINEIDEQHQELFVLLNEFDDAISAHKTNDVVNEVLARLISYTTRHFALEEEVMRLGHYPDLEAHIVQHRDLVKDIEKFIARADAGEHIAYELNHFLRKWLVNHIKHSDLGYAKFFATGKHQSIDELKVTIEVKEHPVKPWWKFW